MTLREVLNRCGVRPEALLDMEVGAPRAEVGAAHPEDAIACVTVSYGSGGGDVDTLELAFGIEDWRDLRARTRPQRRRRERG